MSLRCLACCTSTVLVWLFLVAGFGSANAQHRFASDRDFKIEKPCTATRSIRRGGDPTSLQPGQTIAASGLNKRFGASHVLLRVGGGEKWAALDCGSFADGNDPVPVSTECLPFFDNENNIRKTRTGDKDPSPPPQAFDAFSTTVAKLCGKPGKVVSEDEFKSLLRNNLAILARIKAFAHNKVFADRPARATDEDYLKDLTEAWFKIKAFDHIMCGEPKNNSIGGLHLHARYASLQEMSKASGGKYGACRMNNFKQNEIADGVIYTIGAVMKTESGGTFRHSTKGYGLTLSAEDILKVVTRALSKNPTNSNSSRGCLVSISDDGHEFKAVFVRRKAGIRTFFPDATPNARHDTHRNTPDCANPISLP